MSYKEALDKVLAASKKFRIVTADYRARRIDDNTYLAERAKMEAAEAEYDAAYAEAQNTPEVNAPEEPSPQTGFAFSSEVPS